VTYDPDTRTVTWTVGALPAATSVPASQSVSFQVTAEPTKDEVGQTVQLLGETTIVGTDTVANVPLTVTRPALTTVLSSDPIYSAGKERVVE